MRKLLFLKDYLVYLYLAKNAHSIHSPFVYKLYHEIFSVKGNYYSYDLIEQLRKKLLLSEKEIEVTDYGTGASGRRTIQQIAAGSLKGKKYCALLFRLVNYFKPKTILELGTSLGITTCYLASAAKKASVITIEGCPNIAEEAKKKFHILDLSNIKLVTGNFDKVLAPTVSQYTKLDFVFFDGNHRKTPTLNYFKQCLLHAHNESLFIFDDIHWSEEMTQAWEEIKSHPEVTTSIDLFFIGLIFFRKEQKKENFIIRF